MSKLSSALLGLSPKLQADILARPTKTILRDQTAVTEAEFEKMPKTGKGRPIPIPDVFDGREVWKGMLTPVRNQGRCGSCWAFASTSCLADRFNIHSGGKLYVELSPARLILCDFLGKDFAVKHPEIDVEKENEVNLSSYDNGACKGNTLYDAWRYLYIFGTNPESCIPYDKKILGSEVVYDSLSSYTKDDRLPLCSSVSGPIGDMCADSSFNKYTGREMGTPARFFRCIHFYAVAGSSVDNGNEEYIRHNIFVWGPVTTGMVVYPDFYLFDPKTEIYEWNGKGETVGGHAIEIVGWGEEKGRKYWIIRNSWGPEWGRNGFFYMARGTNTCKIEENVVTGIPDFFYPENYPLSNPAGLVWGETKEVVSERRSIDTDFSMASGGINPETGYTRRAMRDKPWIITSRPVAISDLPDRNTFIAGKITKDVFSRNYRKIIFFTSLGILGFFLCFVILYKVRRRLINVEK